MRAWNRKCIKIVDGCTYCVSTCNLQRCTNHFSIHSITQNIFSHWMFNEITLIVHRSQDVISTHSVMFILIFFLCILDVKHSHGFVMFKKNVFHKENFSLCNPHSLHWFSLQVIAVTLHHMSLHHMENQVSMVFQDWKVYSLKPSSFRFLREKLR